jgi:hypothetical protein
VVEEIVARLLSLLAERELPLTLGPEGRGSTTSGREPVSV